MFRLVRLKFTGKSILRLQSTIAREACSDCQLLFPWRERPPVHNSPANVVKLLYSRSVLSVVEKEDDFLTGANVAFQCAVEAIFCHPILRNHIILTKEQASTQIVEEAPVIDVVLEDRLASFYEDAIRNFVKNPRYRLSQQLVRVNKYHIVSGEMLFYSEALNNHEFLERHPQKIFGIGVLRPQHSGDGDKSEIDRLLLRLWVDFECSEVFMVKDVEKDEVIQGSDSAETVVHQILLESSIQIPKGKSLKNLDFVLASDWKLVDIDHWMEGNDSWIQNNFQ